MSELVDHFLFFSDNITNENIIFDDIETRHMHNVLRLSEGDLVKVTDGKGFIYTVKLNNITKRSSLATIVEKEKFQRDSRITLYMGIPEKDSFERVLPMIVPQGVDTIVPVVCDYCQKPWWDQKWDKVIERFYRVMVTSSKQCWNPNIPKILSPKSFKEVIGENHQNLFFADENGVLSSELKQDDLKGGSVSCFVGPPGGFSEDEKDLLSQNGKGISLSHFRLRTELASSMLITSLYDSGIINTLEKLS